MLSHQGRTIKDRMKVMSNEVKIQKTTGGVVHMGQRMEDYFSPACGSGVVYAPSTLRNIAKFREVTSEVTCKKCLKLVRKSEGLGLHLKSVRNEDGSYRVIDTRKEDTVRDETEAEAPTVPATLADQIAQIRANREAEEEARAAERRARNRTNYAPAPESTERKAKPFTFQYDAVTGISIAETLREKAEEYRRTAAKYRELEGQLVDFYADQARLADNNAQLLEDAANDIHAPVKARLAEEMGRALDAAMEEPFHRQVKDAVDLKW